MKLTVARFVLLTLITSYLTVHTLAKADAQTDAAATSNGATTATAPTDTSQAAASADTEQNPDVAPAAGTQQPAEVTLHPEHLNPAFVLSGQTLQALVKKGQDAFNRQESNDDVVKPYVKHPRGVIGEKGVSRNSRVILNTDGAMSEIELVGRFVCLWPL